MNKKFYGIDILIDKLTNSVENTISGDSFKTNVLPLGKDDLKKMKKKDWAFDWHKEYKIPTNSCLNWLFTTIRLSSRG
jgi:hypothetical protein